MGYEVEFFTDQGWGKNRNSINIAEKTDVTSKSAMFYQIKNSDTSLKLTGMSPLPLQSGRSFGKTTFPGYRRKSFPPSIPKRYIFESSYPCNSLGLVQINTYFLIFFQIQGQRNTYYVGSHLSFEVTAFCRAHSCQMVKGMFKPVITLGE